VNSIDPNDKDYLKPSRDPNKPELGIRAVTSTNDGSARAVSTVRGHVIITDEPSGTDTGPTPMENVLASLLGCESVIIHLVAKAMDFKYSGADMESEGEIDRRGSAGVIGIKPYFSWVKVKITLKTNESAKRVEQLKKNVHLRCPAMNLLKDANVKVEDEWIVVPE